jgi:hypothetical protein
MSEQLKADLRWLFAAAFDVEKHQWRNVPEYHVFRGIFGINAPEIMAELGLAPQTMWRECADLPGYEQRINPDGYSETRPIQEGS